MKKRELRESLTAMRRQEQLLLKSYREVFLKVDSAKENLKCQQDLNKFLLDRNKLLEEKTLVQDVSLSTGKVFREQVEEIFTQNGLSALSQMNQLVQNINIFFSVKKDSLDSFKELLTDKYNQVLTNVQSLQERLEDIILSLNAKGDPKVIKQIKENELILVPETKMRQQVQLISFYKSLQQSCERENEQMQRKISTQQAIITDLMEKMQELSGSRK